MTAEYRDYGYTSHGTSWPTSYLMSPLRPLIDFRKGAILDLGCGNGAIARSLIAEGYDVYGVDASTSGIAIANAHAPGRFFVMDIGEARLPDALADKRFATVISTEVIEHLYDPRGFLRLARQVLADAGGGDLIVSTPYHGYLKNLALAVTGKLDAHFTALWDGGHIKFFSRSTLEQMLREEGFDVQAFVGAGRWPFLWKSMLMKARLAR
jgi:2-polyprenyl-3-methyl-5-hydroxy-6-metoxy-1,4-benzoquinol methylase